MCKKGRKKAQRDIRNQIKVNNRQGRYAEVRIVQKWSDRKMRKMRSEKFHNLYRPPTVISVKIVYSISMQWAAHVARIGDIEIYKELESQTLSGK